MEFTGCGKIKAIGKIFTIVKADKSNYKFRDVCFFIVKDSLPPILGKDFIIENSSTDNGNFKIHGHGMEIYLRNGMRVLFPWSETAALFKMDSGKLSTRQKLEVLEKTKEIKLDDTIFKGEHFERLVDLLFRKQRVFKGPNDQIGLFSEKVRIPTVPGLTKGARPRPIPKHLQPQVEEEIKRMIDEGIIEDCENGGGFHSPLVIVRKKNNKIRICSDFKSGLNQCLTEETDLWNVPNIDCLFADIERGNTIFSDIDISAAYWNLEIHEDDRYKTNFYYNDRLYQYVRLPFGLKHSGDSFCRSLAEMLATVKLKNHFKNYIDDLLLFSNDENTHLQVLEQILDACDNYGVKLGGPKCHFGKRSTKFMGRQISPEGISIPEENMKALKELPAPRNRKELLSVLGTLGWWKS